MNLKKLNKGLTRRAMTEGFTLIEILVVIGIIAVLAAIVIVAINPARQFAQARNTQRISNVETILNAIGQRIADNKGIFAGTVVSGSDCPNLTTSGTGALTADTAYNILKSGTAGSGDVLLSCVVPTYIPIFPTDPSYTSGDDTLYDIKISSIGRVTICAPEMLTETAVTTVSGNECLTR